MTTACHPERSESGVEWVYVTKVTLGTWISPCGKALVEMTKRSA